MSDTRESWLLQLTEKLRPMFEGIGFKLPEKIRASCGFPSKGALASKAKRIGECWSDDKSEDQHFETFVSPLLSDVAEVAATQVHELCHAAVGVKCGHRKPFTTVAKAVGLEGKMTSTSAGVELASKLQKLTDEIGPYPHAKLVHSSSPKKQGTRMLLVKCPKPECGYQVRTTKKWIEVGLPTCPCGEKMVAELPETEEESEDGGGD
jgi:hypothetical protein